MADDVTADAAEEQVAELETTEPAVDAVAIIDGAYVLFVADFTDADAAWQAYETLQEVEDEIPLQVEGVLVLKRSTSGELEIQKVTDPSTRRGLSWGVVGGVVLGILFPPTVLGSAVVLGAAGAGIGKAREVHHRRELAEELADAIDPGHSGLVALVSDPAAVKVQKAVDEALAAEIKAEAKAAEGQPAASEAATPADQPASAEAATPKADA